MIRRELADGTVLLIPQEHHADVAAQFAAHWGGGRFATPRPYQSVVFATIYHDSGHREVEADLPVDVEIGAPYGHRDMPAAFKRPEANVANAMWIGTRDPYAALLASMHRTGLGKRRYGTVRSWQTDYASVSPPTADGPAGREAAFADMEPWQLEHMASLGLTDTPSQGALWFNYRLLQVFDLLSLYFCCDDDDGSMREVTLGGVPVDYGSAAGAEVHLTPAGESTVKMAPYPLDESPLQVSVLARRMAPITGFSEADVREAYYRSPRHLLSWELVAG